MPANQGLKFWLDQVDPKLLVWPWTKPKFTGLTKKTNQNLYQNPKQNQIKKKHKNSKMFYQNLAKH